MSVHDAKSISSEPLPEKEARWVKMVKKIYADPHGGVRTWECTERRTRPANRDLDGVGIVAILEKDTGPQIVLQKQFRPPVERVVIELPAGLMDDGETAEQAALRELKEETGYVGRVVEVSPIMFNDSGFCNTNLKMVHVVVDPDLPENRTPRPELEENEFIETFLVPLDDLWAECQRLAAEGYAIDARVGDIGKGVELAKTFKFQTR